jgi:hypothetical protein
VVEMFVALAKTLGSAKAVSATVQMFSGCSI